MERDTVIFRKWKSNGEILALFPDIPMSVGLCASYEHIGQHGAADYRGCLRNSMPATAQEYASLYQELVNIGYTLIVRKRWTGRT